MLPSEKETIKKLTHIFSTEFEGNSIEDAVKKATEALKMSAEELSIKVLFEGQPGLFGLKGSKPAKIKVTPNVEKVENLIKFFFLKLLNFIYESIVHVDITIEENNIIINTILNNVETLKIIKKDDIFDSIFTITKSFTDKILPGYQLKLNFKISSTSNQ